MLLLGSAHVVDLDGPIRATLRDRPLDAIAVELDEERARVMLSEEPPGKGGGRGGEAPLFLRLWGVIQRRLGGELGAGVAGAEMRSAARLAKERGIPLLLIDDPIRDTIRQLIGALSPKERVLLLVGSIVGLVIPSRVVRKELDRYAEAPGDYVGELRRRTPAWPGSSWTSGTSTWRPDSSRPAGTGTGRVAAVVGDAHVPGLAEALRRRGVPSETVAFGQLRGTTTS